MEKEKLTKRQIQAINTKNKIYNVAIKLMIEEGYDNITVSKICEKAKVSIGSFYHYFKAKEDVIIEAYKIEDAYFQNYIKNDLKSTNAIDQIIEYTMHTIEYVVNNTGLELMAILYKSQIKNGEKFFSSNNRLISCLIIDSIIKPGQERNEIRNDMTAEEITNFLLMFNRGYIYEWCVRNGEYDIEQVAHKAVKHIVKMFEPIKG